MKKIIYLLFTATLFLATACDKEDDMTSDSSNNHDILRCKINGENWTPKVAGFDLVYPFELNYYRDIERLELLVKNNAGSSILQGSIYIRCNVDSVNTLNKIIFREDVIKNNNYSYECSAFGLDTLTTNFIQITSIDTLNFVMTGKFECSAINDCQDTIRVTEGYFDLNYFF